MENVIFWKNQARYELNNYLKMLKETLDMTSFKHILGRFEASVEGYCFAGVITSVDKDDYLAKAKAIIDKMEGVL